MSNKKARITMGGVLAASGLWLRALQICFMGFGVAAATNSVITLVITCITVGGFCVMAAERRGAAAVAALSAAVFTLCGIMSSASLKLLGTVSMFLTFAAFVCLMFILPKNSLRRLTAVSDAVLSVLVLLQTLGVLNMPSILLSVVLVLIYCAAGVGLIL